MTIRVKVELMPTLRRFREKTKFDLELPDDANVRMLLTELGFKEDEMEHLRIFVNNEFAQFEKVLKDGDTIWVGIVVGGGLIGVPLSAKDRGSRRAAGEAI